MDKQYVIFKLENEEYAIEIMSVQEITTYSEPTAIPDAPGYIHGVMNLRGNIVPIVDLKERLRVKNTVPNESKRIVIVNIDEHQLGVIVDDASQVLTLQQNQIDVAPRVIQSKNQNLISGIGKSGEKIIMILDFEALLNKQEMEYVM